MFHQFENSFCSQPFTAFWRSSSKCWPQVTSSCECTDEAKSDFELTHKVLSLPSTESELCHARTQCQISTDRNVCSGCLSSQFFLSLTVNFRSDRLTSFHTFDKQRSHSIPKYGGHHLPCFSHLSWFFIAALTALRYHEQKRGSTMLPLSLLEVYRVTDNTTISTNQQWWLLSQQSLYFKAKTCHEKIKLCFKITMLITNKNSIVITESFYDDRVILIITSFADMLRNQFNNMNIPLSHWPVR